MDTEFVPKKKYLINFPKLLFHGEHQLRKKLNKMKRMLLSILILGILLGCSAYKASTNFIIIESALRIATDRVLRANPTWVEPTYRFTVIAIGVLNEQSTVDLSVIDTLFVETIEKYLAPEELGLAFDIFKTIKEEVYRDLIRRGIKDPTEQKVYVLTVLKWINQTAFMRM